MSNESLIPLIVPHLAGNEWKYIKDCLDTGWISSVGSYVTKFENAVADYVGADFGVAAVNGTAALHIGFILAGVKRGDYVIIPDVTFVATANAVMYTGAEPILIDIDKDKWQMDLDVLEEFLKEKTKLNASGERVLAENGRCIRAIVPVHIQGNMCDMERFLQISDEYNLFVVEDAAESLGTTYKGKHSGVFGEIGCFSFNGNKVISTGGGGVIVTNNEALAKRAKHITTTAKVDPMNYFHDEVGYNYRMVNVLAALGVAQMEQLEGFLKRKREVASYYINELSGVGDIEFQKVSSAVDHNYWMFTIKTNKQQDLLKYLNDNKIISRPFWMPMSKLPMYEKCEYVSQENNGYHIHETCLALPCSTNISDQQLEIVVKHVKHIVE